MSAVGLGRHAADERLPRHRHAEGYIAVVLGGGYEEAGDAGRFTLRPGMVVVHGGWTAHLDRFGVHGAEVLNLPLAPGLAPGVGTIDDPDAAARLAERDPRAATAFVAERFRASDERHADWPDLLAAALSADPDLAIASWARGIGLDPASVSRGFARAYGASPKRFRIEARTRRALAALSGWRGTLADLAADQGFADQAHMARAIAAMTGVPPIRLRAKSVQASRGPRR
ncbi:helix-turn-helix domain-containing protein [Sphingopyxis sp. FD7]|uniref:helix-turn-helix domain-containing protein n=1 Tax=Sphingopyxis sp. FD7 TaxID=1914525 RepID=UPI000DC63AF0|nr:helix-turn-helix domain-containing protein [Sphingopyxis sp. FD7]BBB12826.1 AraC family transcriptional regulator [Sphingopyxis sp. FD7]